MQITSLADSTFCDATTTNKNVVVKCYTPWCGPCKSMSAMYKVVATGSTNTDTVFAEIDVDENHTVSDMYGIKNVPAFLFFKNGELVQKHLGTVQIDAFKKMLSTVF